MSKPSRTKSTSNSSQALKPATGTTASFAWTAINSRFCLDMNGKPRPTEFRTSPGSGHAYETLTRASHSRPENVTGGTPQVRQDLSSSTTHDCTGFEFVESPTLKQLQGEWTAV